MILKRKKEVLLSNPQGNLGVNIDLDIFLHFSTRCGCVCDGDELDYVNIRSVKSFWSESLAEKLSELCLLMRSILFGCSR